jgi:hypothetical protein
MFGIFEIGVGWCKLFGAFGNGVWAWRPLIEKKEKKRVDVHLNKISQLKPVSFSAGQTMSKYVGSKRTSQIPGRKKVVLIVVHS